MTKRIAMVLGTALLAAGLSFTSLRPAAAQSNVNKGGAGDRPSAGSTAHDHPGAGKATGAADKTSTDDKMNVNALGAADLAFAKEAAMGSLGELELAKLAAEHATTKEVKQFAQQMITDHSRMSDELRPVAARKNIELPQELDAKTRALRDRLFQTSQRSGIEFDREYIKQMVQDHEQDLALFQREASSGRDPDLQRLAQKNLPTIQEHLRMARTLNENLKKNRTANR